MSKCIQALPNGLRIAGKRVSSSRRLIDNFSGLSRKDRWLTRKKLVDDSKTVAFSTSLRSSFSSTITNTSNPSQSSALETSDNPIPSLDAVKIKSDIIQVLRENDFEAGKLIYEKMRAAGYLQNLQLVESVIAFLTICGKKDHLPLVLQVKEDLMTLKNSGQYENVYRALFRCYGDEGNVDQIWRVIKEQGDAGIPYRLRTFQALLELYQKNRDIDGIFTTFEFIKSVGLPIRMEQLSLLLQTFAEISYQCSLDGSEVNIDKLTKIVVRLEKVLLEAKKSVLGLAYEDLVAITSKMNNQSLSEVSSFGGLVDSLSDLVGPILSNKRLKVDGSLVAYNVTFKNYFDANDDSLTSINHDPYLPLGLLNMDQVTFAPEKFIVWKERVKALQSTNPQQLVKEKSWNARLTVISGWTKKCPHCEGTVTKSIIGEEQKKKVRDAIFHTAAEHSPAYEGHLRSFDSWLRSREEYEYIVDAANVAYSSQNYEFGRFSYGQVLYHSFIQSALRLFLVVFNSNFIMTLHRSN